MIMDEVDARIEAWHKVSSHPFFRKCYAEDSSLIDAMVRKLDAFSSEPESAAVETVRAEEPVEDRLARAYVNGFREGMERAARGRLDHW